MIPVSIVILSNNRVEEVSKNLPSLLSAMHNEEEFEIIVVDNNSTDGTLEVLEQIRKQYPLVRIIKNEQNLGVALGRNAGFDVASRDYIVSLDDDSHIYIENLRKIHALFEADKELGILAFKVVHAVTGNKQTEHGEISCKVANHHGAGFAVRRQLYLNVGGMDPECTFGAEELDFAIRVYDYGFKVQYIPEVVIYHNSFRRTTSTDKSRRIRLLYNNVRIYHKYFPQWMALRNSTRYFVTAVSSWIALYGFVSIQDLFAAYFAGRNSGIACSRQVSKPTQVFYNDPTLRPFFGNVPLTRKLIQVLKRRWRLQ